MSFAVIFHAVEVIPVMVIGFPVTVSGDMNSREIFGKRGDGDNGEAERDTGKRWEDADTESGGME